MDSAEYLADSVRTPSDSVGLGPAYMRPFSRGGHRPRSGQPAVEAAEFMEAQA